MDEQNITPEAIEFAGLHKVSYQKLPWEEKVTIMWGWFWRSVVVTIGTATAVGIFLALSMAFFKMLNSDVSPAILAFVGLVMGLAMTIVTIHPLIAWLLSTRIGRYRLLLCETRHDQSITIERPGERKIVAL